MSEVAQTQADSAKKIRDAVARITTTKESGERPNLVEVLALAGVMADSFETFYSTLDNEVYAEFRAIANHIDSMRSDIATLQPHEMKNVRMPEAGRELDAIVKATEDATNTIMTSAEAIMGADTSDHAAYQATVNDEVMKIFEACSFQDVTGQRVTKVVETLRFIETRIDRLAQTIGSVADADWSTDEERAAEARKEDQMLNGPQHEGEGASQDDIDAMFD